MKNIIITLSALSVGLLIGYLIFGSNNTQTSDDTYKHEEVITENGEEIWTCSMHPQIKLPEPGDCPICGMDLIPLNKNTSDDPLVVSMTKEAIKLSNIQTTVVGGGNALDGQNNLKLSGKIQADETTTASIVSHIPGRIEKLYISFTGEKVSKGQKIATIYSPNLITAQKELIEANKVKATNPALFEATKNKLKYWKITDQQIEEILSENKMKEYFNIYADHSGVVTKRKVSVGDHLMEGGVLFEIQNLNKLWVIFDVYESDLSKIKRGDVITFITPSVPNQEFKAGITFINPVIDANTRTGSVRVEVLNLNGQLMPEMFVNGEVILNSNQSGGNATITVPKSAVLWTGERSIVYVKLANKDIPSFQFREITIGESIGDNFVVLAGLKLGEEIVVNGAFVVDASAQLNNQASMMNRNVTIDHSTMDMDDKATNEDNGGMKCEAGKCGDGM